MKKADIFTGVVAGLLMLGTFGPGINPAYAQQSQTAPQAGENQAGEATAEISERDLKLQLARKMHEIRPTRLQVQAAISQIARRSVPEAEREDFESRMMAALDIEALEEASIDAMVEVFTLPEMEQMVAYHMTPEARSISQKMPMFQGIIQPQLMKMLDNAMLKMRTGQ